MLRTLAQTIDRVLAPVPGWLVLLAGLVLAALAVLMPAWVESRHLAWQLDLVRRQAVVLEEQEHGYARFQEALAADDPVLLERLAFYHLRLKPAGAAALEPAQASRSGAALVSHAPAAGPRREPRTPSIEEMLHRPMPEPGLNYPFYQPVRSRLVRITTGVSRFVLLAAGLACAVGGLFMGTRGPTADARPSTR